MSLLIEDQWLRLKYRNGSLRHTVWLIVFLLFLLLPIAGVSAQDEFRVSFSPEESAVPVGGMETIKIAVENGINLNAYDLKILYDSNKVSLASWSHGDFLSNLAVVYYENEPGKLHIAATQLATPGVSGDGVLLNLVFSGVVEGVSALTLVDVEFYDPTGKGVNPDITEGVITVERAEPTFTPTYTVTPIYSPTPTRAHTTTKTATSTPFLTSTLFPTQTQGWLTNTPSVDQVITTTTGDHTITSSQVAVTPGSHGTITAQAVKPEPGDAEGQVEDRETDTVKDGILKFVNSTLWVFVFLLSSAMIAFIYLIFFRKKNEK